MDQKGMLNSLNLSTCSLLSLEDESETINEAEEIEEVKLLQELGDQAAETSNLDEALKYYNEALEIDSKNIKVLKSRALAYLQQQKPEKATEDAETILTIDANKYHGYFIKGLIHEHMNMSKSSLGAFLTALNHKPRAADKLTYHIAQSVSTYCQVSSDLTDSLQAMHPYEKLSEIGIILFQNKKFEACNSVLEAAGKVQTNQKGITMRILLTQANAHSQLMHTETAIRLYQECLDLALATHDQAYQTKCLVNIAALYLDSNDVCQAIVFNEKLLHLEAELLTKAGLETMMPEYWTKDLQCGLHLNLSIAYKTIGNTTSAIEHAKIYLMLTEKFDLEAKFGAEAHYNLGVLLEIIGNYQEALQCYKEYLSISQRNGNDLNIGQAYGCLARVNAALKHWSLSLSLHDQYIAMAIASRDNKMKADAHEIKGDTLCMKGDYQQALDQYNKMQKLCHNHDSSRTATSFLKMARAHKNLGQTQTSLYYCNETMSIARRFGLEEIEKMAEFHAACIKNYSSQHQEREEALNSFLRLIPYFEKNILQQKEEHGQSLQKYEQYLNQCFDGMQTVAALAANKMECLQYAETHRRHSVISIPDICSTWHRADSHNKNPSIEIWDEEYIKRMISAQSAIILYYSVLESLLLLWVLQPTEGIAHFSVTKASHNQKFTHQISDLLLEMREGWDRMELINTSEARALPHRDGQTMHLSSQNLRLYSEKSEVTNNASRPQEQRPPLQRLYNLLVAPVSEILDKLDKGSHIIVIPDKQLKFCPFGSLLDYKNKPLSNSIKKRQVELFTYQVPVVAELVPREMTQKDRFRISYIPCLLLLDQVTKNEISSRSTEDGLEFQRRQARNGQLPKEISEQIPKEINEQSENLTLDKNSQDSTVISDLDSLHLNLKEVSNPRLASSMTQITFAKTPRTLRNQESTCYSSGDVSFRETSTSVADNGKLMKHLSQSEDFGNIFAGHTYSTLTTRTWTDTNITSSSQVVTQFQQISDTRIALVFGCPKINQELKIHGREWTPKSELARAQKELMLVAKCLDTDPIIGEQATKQELMCRLETAEIVHIATWACFREGLLLVRPESLTGQSEDSSHLVTISEILSLKLQAKLVVLSSSGLTPARVDQECTMKLASSFLSAGALCVLVSMWPIPDDTLCKFMFHFYLTFQNGELVSEALHNGTKSIQDDGRWNHVCYWSCFAMIGKDTTVNSNVIKHARLDQIIDQCEQLVDSQSDKPILNPKAAVANVASKEENLAMLQKHVKALLLDHYNNPQIIQGLIHLLDSALTRLHIQKNNDQPVQFEVKEHGSHCALALLKWLGFHFQAKSIQLTHMYIIFPYWNTDEMLIPAYDVLKATRELVCNPNYISALCEALPLTQENISSLIDLMSITKHAPEIQLRVRDVSVNPLWHSTKIRTWLSTVGYHQVGPLLALNALPDQKRLLVSTLQVLLSFSCHKSQVLLYRLDVDLLGHAGDTTKDFQTSFHNLPSLRPKLLSRNQLRNSTPWLSMIETRHEMHEKMKLAKSTSDLSREYVKHLQRAKTWHHMSVVAQANETLDTYGRPLPVPKTKVMVKSGSTLSQRRVPIDEERQLTRHEIKQRRDHAHIVLQERLEDIEIRRKDGLIKLYLPYIKP